MTFIEKIKSLHKQYGMKKLIKRIYLIMKPGKSFFQLYSLKESYEIYNKLEKKYDSEIIIYRDEGDDKPVNQVIYTAWLQGEDKAPMIVKACWESMKRNMPEYRLIILTEDNYRQYTKLDSMIEEKYKRKIISRAHFSDILRTKVLVDNGGIWLDSTVLCTDNKLIHYLDSENIDFFVFQNMKRNDDTSVLSSWLIYAKKNNSILKSVYELLVKYWKSNNVLEDYFLYHKLFTLVSHHYPNEWGKMPVLSNIDSHLLQHELFTKYNKARYGQLRELCSYHKLTHKYSKDLEDKEDTVFHHIMNEFIPEEKE